jgi:hypothetical protein
MELHRPGARSGLLVVVKMVKVATVTGEFQIQSKFSRRVFALAHRSISNRKAVPSRGEWRRVEADGPAV